MANPTMTPSGVEQVSRAEELVFAVAANPTMTPSGVEQRKLTQKVGRSVAANPTMTPSGVEQCLLGACILDPAAREPDNDALGR